jgi:serine/threonine protein kinase
MNRQELERPAELTVDRTRTDTPLDSQDAPPGSLRLPVTGFDLEEEIGRGGMGLVWRARDLALDREVAVKVLLDQHAPGSGVSVRFLEEARITAQLQHPGIPAVYQAGSLPDGRPFLAMKLIRGKTLDGLLREQGPDPVRWLAVFEGICQAVGFAHARRVIDRDLKPHNVMVGAFGEVQVMDWGLAKVLSAEVVSASASAPAMDGDGQAATALTEGISSIDSATIAHTDHPVSGGESVRPLRDSSGSFTQDGSVLGTPAYMPPEQAQGSLARVDSRSDVFGLGAILCALLTGKPPFTGQSLDSIRRAATRGSTDEAFARLDACGADPEVIALCKRCLAFDREDRPVDGGAVAEEIAALRRGSEERARQAELDRLGAEVKVAEGRKRRRVIEWSAVTVIVALAGGAGAALWQTRVAVAETGRARAAEQVANEQRDAARDAYDLARSSLLKVGTDLPVVLDQSIYAREVRQRAAEVLADSLSSQLDPTALRGLPGRSVLALKLRIAKSLQDIGRADDARRMFAEALELSRTLMAAGGEEAAISEGNHALLLLEQARHERDSRRTKETVEASLVRFAEVMAIQRRRLANPPKDFDAVELRQSLATTLGEAATSQKMLRRLDEAAKAAAEAVELLRPRPGDAPPTRYSAARPMHLARMLAELGKIEVQRQNDPEAEKALREAVSVSAAATAADPANPTVRLVASRAARELGDFLLMRNRLDDAAKEYDSDAAHFRPLLDTVELKQLRFELGDSYYRAATLDLKRGRRESSVTLYRRCRDLWREVSETRGTNSNRLALALVQARLGEHQTAAATARATLAAPAFTPGEGIQAVSALALCGGAVEGELRQTYFKESIAGLKVLVNKLGYRNVARLKTDPDLDPIRPEPAFQEIIKALSAPPAPTPAKKP